MTLRTNKLGLRSLQIVVALIDCGDHNPDTQCARHFPIETHARGHNAARASGVTRSVSGSGCSRTLSGVLLSAVVETSRAVAATRSRKTKIEALAVTLRACAPDEIATVVNLLTGEPRQGRIGVGWATLSAARNAAEHNEPDE